MRVATAALVLLSYLLGSLPVGLLVARRVSGVDIRSRGSGNIGTANVVRVSGWAAGALVLVADVLKGALPVLAARWLGLPGLVAAAAGLAAVAGHDWSLFLRFRGGKGVATSLGVVLVFAPAAALALVLVWAAIVAATRYSSLGSLAGLVLAAPAVRLAGGPPEAVWFCLAAAALGVWRHRENIARLASGREHRLGGPGRPRDA